MKQRIFSISDPGRMERIIEALLKVCEQRGLEPHSSHGREVIARILMECEGSESADEMARRFVH